MSQINLLQNAVQEFRDKRDWKQFHNPKDMAISLALEANELLEIFQWKTLQEIDETTLELKPAISEELADIFYWVLLMASDLDIDLQEVFDRKMLINEQKYPREKVKGRKDKYTEYK